MDGLQINLESSSLEMPINLEDVASPMEGVTSGHKVKRKRKLTSKEFNICEIEELGANTQKSQLELYLEEPRMVTEIELNVLDYWKANQFRYPEVASMARDLLSIPISTVASEFLLALVDSIRSISLHLSYSSVKGLIARISDRDLVSRTSDRGLIAWTSDRGLVSRTSDMDLISRISGVLYLRHFSRMHQ
nr:uncharacterized protein LOC107412983 [Ziziphus jujuba var. spinosa]